MELFDKGLHSLKFWAEWCAPCKLLDPKIETIKKEFTSIEYHSINIDDQNDLVKEFQIKSVPTVILLKDGLEINRITGAVLIQPLRKAYREFAKEENDRKENIKE